MISKKDVHLFFCGALSREKVAELRLRVVNALNQTGEPNIDAQLLKWLNELYTPGQFDDVFPWAPGFNRDQMLFEEIRKLIDFEEPIETKSDVDLLQNYYSPPSLND